MKRTVLIALLLLVPAVPGQASEAVRAVTHSGADGQEPIKMAPEELAAHDAVKNAATYEETIAAARDFLTKYPDSKGRNNMEVFVYNKIVEGPADESRLSKIQQFKELFPQSERIVGLELTMSNFYLGKRDFAELMRVGEAYLAVHPDDVDTHYLLLRISVDALRNQDSSLIPKGKEHGLKAVELFNAPGLPSRFPSEAEWAKYKSTNLPLAYQSLGVIGLATEDTALASEYFDKAIAANPKDALNYFFVASLREQDYTKAASRYNAMEDRSSPEAVAALEEANQRSDEIIEFLVKAVAHAEPGSQIATQARTTLELHYKRRHDGGLEGLEERIRKVREGGA